MAWKSAEALKISEKQQKILESFAKGTHAPLHLKTRSQIILLAAVGHSNNQIHKNLGMSRDTVIRWRNRYGEAFSELEKIEQEEPRQLKQLIVGLLSDDQRPGKPPVITDLQKALITALSLQDPTELGLSFSHWSSELLRVEAIKRGIVESISARHINRFLKESRFEAEPHPKLADSRHRG